MRPCASLLCACSLALLPLVRGQAAAASPLAFIGAYYNNWQATLVPPTSIPFALLDHVQYFVAVPTNAGALGDFDTSLANQVVAAAKAAGPTKQVHLVVGGWSGSGNFSTLLRTPEGQNSFAETLVNAVKSGGFSGVEIDSDTSCTYPGGGVASRQGMVCNAKDAADGTNLVSFLKALRQKMPAPALIGMAVDYLGISGLTSYADLAASLDYAVIMAYDAANPNISPKQIGTNSPLNDCGDIPGSASSAIAHYTSKGWPANKLVMGLPTYGYGWDGVPTAPANLPAPFSGTPVGGATSSPAGPDGCGTVYPASANLNFNELVGRKLDATGLIAQPGWTRTIDNCSQTPVLYGQQTVISYDDPTSIALKATLARCKGLLGLSFFSTTGDTTDHLLFNAGIKAFTGTGGCEAVSASATTTGSSGSSSSAVAPPAGSGSSGVKPDPPAGSSSSSTLGVSSCGLNVLATLVVLLYIA